MTFRQRSVLVFIAALAASSMLVARGAASPQDAIVAHGRQWSALYEAGRINEMRALYEPDAWLMTEGAPAAKGVDAILAFLLRNKASGNHVVFSFTPEQITLDEHHAFLISEYRMMIDTPQGGHIESAGRSFVVYKRGIDGAWRIWRDIDNRAPDVTVDPERADGATSSRR